MKWCVHDTDTGDITIQIVWVIVKLIVNEGMRIWENINSREMEAYQYVRSESPTHEPVANFGFLLQWVQTVATMEYYASCTRVVESASSQFRSCRMMLIWPWVRVEADQVGDLEHANMIVFIMKKSDLANETDHSCSIYMCQLISDFIHLRKEIQSYESLQAKWPKSEPCFHHHADL